MKKILALFTALIITSHVYSQWSIGLGAEYAWNRMVNVNPDELRPYGHSGKQTNQRSNQLLQPILFVSKTIGKYFDIEMGVGYTEMSHSWDFDYRNQWGIEMRDITVTFTDQWLTLPVNLGYNYTLPNRDKLRIGLGMRTQILLKGEDNYMETVFESMDIVASHNYLAFSPELSFAFKKQISDKIYLQLGVLSSINPFPITGPEWGFYGNIRHAKQIQYGIFLKTQYRI